MYLTYRYRLLLSRRQRRALEDLLESQRQLYNAALEERVGAYRRGVRRSYFDQTKALTEWRRSDPEAASVCVKIQRATLRRVDSAFNAYFRRVEQGAKKVGFPRFRGKGWWDSFGLADYEGGLDGQWLTVKGVPGRLKIHLHRTLPENVRIRSCVFRRDAKGWSVGFVLEFQPKSLREMRRSVGVDMGISTFVALSDGGSIPSLRAARRAERRLRVAQRSLSRKSRAGRNRLKARLEVARCHADIARMRANHLHQASARLVRDYDLIAIESLNLAPLVRGPFAKDMRDAAFGKFISMLRYKAERAGARVIEVDPKFTSQECSACGNEVAKPLKSRQHDCPHCGLRIDRDLNAARNILARAGVGPGLLNVVGCNDKRADGNLVVLDTA